MDPQVYTGEGIIHTAAVSDSLAECWGLHTRKMKTINMSMEFCLRYTDMLSRVSMKGCPTVQQPEPVMRFHWTTSTASIAINAYASQLARETRCCHSYRTKNSPHSTSMKTTNRSKCSYSSELPAMAKASTPQLMRITSWYTSFWKWWQGNYGRALFNKVSIKLNISVLPHVNCEEKIYINERHIGQ